MNFFFFYFYTVPSHTIEYLNYLADSGSHFTEYELDVENIHYSSPELNIRNI